MKTFVGQLLFIVERADATRGKAHIASYWSDESCLCTRITVARDRTPEYSEGS